MPNFNKLLKFLLLGFFIFSISGFTTQNNLQTIFPNIQNESQANDSPTLTPTLLDSIQPTPGKNHKPPTPTKTPRPTATPPVIPPPPDPGSINMMIGFAILAVIVVLMGFWINRHRVF